MGRFRHVGDDTEWEVCTRAQFGRSDSGLGCIHVRSHQTRVSVLRPCTNSATHLSRYSIFRIEKAIHDQYGTRAALEFILALQAHDPVQDQQNAKTWLKQQTIVVLSSIKQSPSVDDAQTFVGAAESEGLPFFSQTCVLVDIWNVSLT